MSKGGGAYGFKAYAGLLLVIASTKSKCHNLSCLEDVMIQSVKNVAWLEWFRLRLPRFLPLAIALVDGLILLHAASYRLNDLTGAWKKLIFLSRKPQS